MGDQEMNLDDAGLPIEPAARAAELDRLIAAGEGEMKADIKSWQADQQRRADHYALLEMKEEVSNVGVGGSKDRQELEGLHSQIQQAIADNEFLMKHNIRGWQDNGNKAERDAHRQLLALQQRLAKRISSLS